MKREASKKTRDSTEVGSIAVILSRPMYVLVAAMFAFLIAGGSLWTFCDAQTTDDSLPPIKIIHSPLDSKSIPAVGTPLRFQVQLLNTYDIESKVRLVGSKDGRFIDIAFPRGALNAVDQPTFSIEIPSPVAVMAYQFVVHQRDGSLTTSPKYILKRQCIQNFKVAVPEGLSNSDYLTSISSLVAKSKLLERETSSLESSLKLIEDIKASLAQ